MFLTVADYFDKLMYLSTYVLRKQKQIARDPDVFLIFIN